MNLTDTPISFGDLSLERLANLSYSGNINYFRNYDQSLKRLKITTYSVMFNTNESVQTEFLPTGLDMLADAAIGDEKTRNLTLSIKQFFREWQMNLPNYVQEPLLGESFPAFVKLKSISGEIGGKQRRIHAHFTFQIGYYIDVDKWKENIKVDFYKIRDRTLEIVNERNPDVKTIAFHYRIVNRDELYDLFYEGKERLKTIMNSDQFLGEFLNLTSY